MKVSKKNLLEFDFLLTVKIYVDMTIKNWYIQLSIILFPCSWLIWRWLVRDTVQVYCGSRASNYTMNTKQKQIIKHILFLMNSYFIIFATPACTAVSSLFLLIWILTLSDLSRLIVFQQSETHLGREHGKGPFHHFIIVQLETVDLSAL